MRRETVVITAQFGGCHGTKEDQRSVAATPFKAAQPASGTVHIITRIMRAAPRANCAGCNYPVTLYAVDRWENLHFRIRGKPRACIRIAERTPISEGHHERAHQR